MATDPFTSVVQHAGDLAPRLAVDAIEERELLPAMLSEVRSFCASHVDGERIDREGRLGEELLAGVVERGWFGLTVPERFGGAGLTLAAATRVVTELAGHNGSLGTCVGLHSGLAMHALLHLGSEEQQERHLPGVAAGRTLLSFAATEPNAGSDISAVHTTLSESDGRLKLDGSKCFVTNGGLCGLVTVLARSPGLGGARAGHTLVLVDPRSPGVSVSREEHKMGLKGSSTVSIDFEGVELAPEQVLGEPSRGLDYAHRALCWGRTFMAAGCLGSAQAALDSAISHTHARVQFGRELARFQLVREALACSRAEVYAIQSTLRLVCALGDSGAGDLALPSTMLKVLASEGAWRVVDSSLQLMGGSGYIEDSGMARRLRDVRVTRIFEGANDVLRLSLASASLTWPADALAEREPDVFEPFHQEAELFHATLAQAASALASLKKRFGFRLFEQQARSAQLAEAWIGLFAALAVLLRPTDEPSVARLAVRLQLDRAARAAEAAIADRDETLTGLLDTAARA
jgi:alkylation response protein AidB-like acyl-CoA dehydrogenase